MRRLIPADRETTTGSTSRTRTTRTTRTTRAARRRTVGAVVALALTMLASTGCALVDSAQPATATTVDELEPIVITTADSVSPDSPSAAGWFALAEAVEEASDGKITFRHHWSGSLIAPGELVEGMQTGIADLAVVLPSYSPSRMRVGDWISRIGSQRNPNFPVGGLQAGGAHAQTLLGSEDVLQEFEQTNLELLAPVYAMQQFDLLCKDPVTDLASAEGRTVRVGGQTWASEAEAIGMVPVTLTPDEMYEGFQRGVVDCVSMAAESYVHLGMTDLGDQYSPVPFSGFNSTYLVANQGFWDLLAPVAREIIWDAVPAFLRGYQERALEGFREFGEDPDMTFNEVDPELVSVLQEHQTASVEGMAGDAPDLLEDPQRILTDYTDALDEWNEVVVDDLAFAELGVDADAWREAYRQEWDLSAWEDELRTRIYEPLAAEVTS